MAAGYGGSLELHYLAKNPFQQFHDWFKEAEVGSGMKYPNSMSLATADKEGRPSVRIVLLKGLSAEGFVFYTNYESRKASQLEENAHAALCLFWDKLHRQVRVEGRVERVSRATSQEYFNTRPRLSRIGAWASHQSQPIGSRAELEKQVHEMEERFRGQEEIPVPEHWGGYVLHPTRLEFWQEGEFRLHDRFTYEKEGDGWKVARLSP
ncbi:MAG: pyridoxamine 5'-phosphate oxidase [Proteobacteria bacterium]|nr:MAG: pyridoxamine 5'-phosphate oxidase [Pseudomonadota bacterium]